MPRATVAALIVLALSAGISFGFVLQRGGLALPAASAPIGMAAAATEANATAGAAASVGAPAPSSRPVASAAAPGSGSPVAQPSPSPSATPSPTPARSPIPSPTPRPSAVASGGVPSADRLAVIKPCPGVAGCWIYRVRLGDNLWSIAHWFGVPLDTVYAWNPALKQAGIEPGTLLKIPTPTR